MAKNGIFVKKISYLTDFMTRIQKKNVTLQVEYFCNLGSNISKSEIL